MITTCTRCGAILDDAEDEIVLVGSGYQHEECAKKSHEWEGVSDATNQVSR